MNDSALVILVKLFSVGVLVLANAFFVAAEFALVAVRRSRIAALAEAGNRRAIITLGVLDHLDAVISATQFGITLASLALGWIGEATLSHLFEPILAFVIPGTIARTITAHTVAAIISFAAITFLHIVLGELAPKSVALSRAESVAMLTAGPLQLFYRVFKPFIMLLNFSGSLVLKFFGLESADGEHRTAYTEEEIRQLVSLSHQSGHLNADERELIHNIFHFTSTVVREVMTPRTAMAALDLGAQRDAILQTFRESGYSRLPVYENQPENIVGTVHSKDLLPFLIQNRPFSLKALLRKPVFVPDSASLEAAMRQLRAAKAQMAMVVDEHGNIEGMVTMEDLLEEIVGEIHDEHDVEAEEAVFWHEPDGTILLDGRISIRDANRKLDLNLPESDDYATLAGFLMNEAGKLLAPGDAVTYHDAAFTVEQVERRRVSRVRLSRQKPEEQAERVGM